MESQDQQSNANSAKQEQVIFTLEDALNAIKKNGIAGITNRIINADCIEVMKGIPDKAMDLVLTDPPYNVGINYEISKDDLSIEEYDKQIKILKELSKTGNWAVLLGSKTETLLTWWNNFPTAKQVIIRVGASVNTTLGGFRPQYRSVLTTVKSNKWWSDHWEDIRFPGEGYFFNEPRFNHPCHAPYALMLKLIECLTLPDQVILDPFCGVGTTAVACKELGRKFIGIEINPKYCEIAQRRLAQEYLFT